MASLDPDLAVQRLQSAEEAIARANLQWQLVGTILAYLASLGLGLASLGMYGLIPRTTAQRAIGPWRSVPRHHPAGARLRSAPGVSLIASWLPARRAARVDPVSTLRAE